MRRVLGATVLLALLALCVVSVRAAMEADRRTVAASRVDTTTTTAAGGTPTSLGVAPTSTTTTTPPAGGEGAPPGEGAGALDPSDGLSLTGIGPIVVGMTVAEAQEAAGVPIGPLPGSAAEAPGAACTYVAARPEDPIVLLMVTDGAISRIDVTEGSEAVTLSGIGIGSTEQEVLDTYGYRIVTEPHPYDEGGSNLRYVADDPTHSLIFEVSDGLVVAFRSGFTEQVGWVEGCA